MGGYLQGPSQRLDVLVHLGHVALMACPAVVPCLLHHGPPHKCCREQALGGLQTRVVETVHLLEHSMAQLVGHWNLWTTRGHILQELLTTGQQAFNHHQAQGQ